ncbi:MAG: hypothetical protein WAN23_13940 [Candidatus Acidiferrales bacterium]
MITETELNVIAALAMMGLSSRPKNGYRAAQGSRADDAAQVAREQRDARSLHRNVRRQVYNGRIFTKTVD